MFPVPLKRREIWKLAKRRQRVATRSIKFMKLFGELSSDWGEFDSFSSKNIFPNVTVIIKSRQYGEWFQNISTDEKIAIIQHLMASCWIKELKKIVDKKSGFLKTWDQLSTAVESFKLYEKERMKRLGYLSIDSWDLSEIEKKLELLPIDHQNPTQKLSKIDDKTLTKVVEEYLISKKQTEEKYENDVRFCSVGKTKKYLLMLAGKTKANLNIRPNTRLYLHSRLKKRGITEMLSTLESKQQPKYERIKLTEYGRRIVYGYR